MENNLKNGTTGTERLEGADGDVLAQIFSFLKERIESPLIMTTIFAWISVNTDFIIFALFDESADKANYLSHWNFSEILPVVGAFESFYSLWLPLLLGLVLTLVTRPVLLTVAGFRYFLSAKSYSYASSNKNLHDNAYQENQLSKIVAEKTEEVQRISASIAEKEGELAEISDKKRAFDESRVMNFVRRSYTELKDIDLEKCIFEDNAKFIVSNSVITFKYNDKERTLPIWEFLLSPEIGFFEDVDLFNWISLKIQLFKNFEVGKPLATKNGVLEIIKVRNVELDPF